jgi:putative transposase
VVVDVLVTEHQLSKARACKIAGLSRTALYRPTVDWAKRDAVVITALSDVVGERTRWGFWKCFHRLRGDGHPWNHKRVHRVYCDMRLNLPRRTKRRKVTRPAQPLERVNALNQMWALDFMHDRLYDGRPFRALNVIDEGNREALRIEVGTSISSGRLIRTMDQLIEVYGTPAGIRMDNGPEMTSERFVEWAKSKGIELRYIQPGKPNQNAFIERFNKSFRAEVLDAYLFNSLSEAQEVAEHWMMDYNEKRPHESLGNVPPTLYMPRCFNGRGL